MIQILGTTRIAVMSALVLLIAGVSALMVLYLFPLREDTDAELSRTNSEISSKRAEIVQLKAEYETLQTKMVDYKELEAKGFFTDQYRVLARDRLSYLSKITGLPNAGTKIEAGKTLENDVLRDAGHVVIVTPIKFDIDTFNDLDIYTFISLLQQRFPGVVGFRRIAISRSGDVTGENLQKIVNGDRISLVESSVDMDWYSVWPQDKLQQGGGY